MKSAISREARPPINPDFAPDESCDFDAYQAKCVPGTSQECHEGFAINEDYACHVQGDCPKGHHGVDNDETGQCYPNSEGCRGHHIVPYILLTDIPGKADRCADPAYICNEEEGRDVPECKQYREELNSDDTMINDIPPDGVGLFCDHPSHPGSCWDLKTNPNL